MDASSRTSTALARSLLLPFALIMIAIFLMKPPLTPSKAVEKSIGRIQRRANG